MIELEREKLQFQAEATIQVQYSGQIVGQYHTDLLIENAVIVELKSITALMQPHEVQLVNYLTATKIDVGLLLNFGPSCVEIRRKVRELGKIRNADETTKPSCQSG